MAVVPRWEWRIFGDDFGDAERRLASESPAEVQESDEVYILTAASDASVKLRDGKMDVKERLAVDEMGLEQWKPVLKERLPLGDADVARVFQALGISRDSTRVDMQVLEIHKRREHHTFMGCMAEITSLRTAGSTTRTMAIEAEDPALVRAAVHELGLGDRRAVCMARGVKALVGLGGERYAVIDVGTNSVKFCIGEREQDGSWRTIVDRAEVTRLGEGLAEAGRLGEQPIERTASAIASMVDEARKKGARGIAAVATAGMRIASNAGDLIQAVRTRSGVEIEVISGDEEARLSYAAVIAALPGVTSDVVVFETGGGSSQFMFGQERFSVNVGAASFTERFGLDAPVSEEVIGEARAAIADELDRLHGRSQPGMVVGMGGAVTNMAAVKQGLTEYDPSAIQGSVLEGGEVERQIELYRSRTADQRREIAGLQPKRAEVILAGACIVLTVLEQLGCDSLTVSDRGLRHGLLVERFGSAA